MAMNQKTKECRIGILGAGRIGKLHAHNIKKHLPQFHLKALADPQIDMQWAQSMSVDLISNKVEDLLYHNDLDAILIASPSNWHLKHIHEASISGKAIFCEKPIGLIEEDIISVLKTVEQNETFLQLGFNRRFDPSFSALQKRVQNGDIGSPHIVKITSRDPACPSKEYAEHSGGMFMDMTIHDFDMARFLMQSEVVEVYATGSVLINPDLEALNDIDTAIIQLCFANGALGVIDNSRQAVYGYDQRIEVFGDGGMLLADNQFEHSITHFSKNGTSQGNPQYFFLERYQQAFLAELNAFYDAWSQSKPSPVSGDDALKALQIAKAAQHSLETQSPVFLK